MVIIIHAAPKEKLMSIISMSSSKINKIIRKSRIDPRAAYLIELSSPYTYGIKKPVGVRPRLPIAAANTYLKKGWSAGISGRKLKMHFAGLETYYYFIRLDADKWQVMIDIDCHGKGTYQGAVDFAKHLQATLFPELYYEPSTNGNGVHGYFYIASEPNFTAADLCEQLGHIQKKLRQVAQDFRADISDVELKGHPVKVKKPEKAFERVTWGWRKLYPEIIGYGQFAKFPRLKTLEDLERLKNTTVLTVEEINSPKFDVAETEKEVSKSVGGSVVWVDEKDTAALGRYEKWANAQSLHNLKTNSSRHVAYAEDFAIGLLVVEKLTGVMKPGDPMRTRRIKGLWDKLYHDGVVSRGFDCHRWKKIRDTLSERGLIDWATCEFVPPVNNQPGKAMVWRWGGELKRVLSQLRATTTTTFVGTTLLTGSGEVCHPIPVYLMTYTPLERYEQMMPDFVQNMIAA